MPPRRKAAKRPLSESDEDEPLSKLKQKKARNASDSSSDSDIEDYLHPVDKIDLNSDFFKLPEKATASTQPSFDEIEKDIFAGVSRLSDSDSDESFQEVAAKEDEAPPSEQADEEPTQKASFQSMQDYEAKIEEMKKLVLQYEAKKQNRADDPNIANLLALGEGMAGPSKELELHSSDYESGSDGEGWEEVEAKQSQKEAEPKANLEITVEMPGAIRVKKKGKDLLAALKRRLNRIRKENQVLIHKVHLLGWLGHGNFVNSIINSEKILALSLSLLPSQHCYPDGRIDLKYLEQILRWYRNAVKHVEKAVPAHRSMLLDQVIEAEIMNRQIHNKKAYICIFAAILRAIGVQCRLVLSFQVEPLRPPTSELHSLSTKESDKKEVTKKHKASTSKTANKESETKTIQSKATTKSENKIKASTSKVADRKPGTTNSKAPTKSEHKIKASTSKTADKKPETKINSRATKSENKTKAVAVKRTAVGKTVAGKEAKSAPTAKTSHKTNGTPSSKPDLKKITERSTRQSSRVKNIPQIDGNWESTSSSDEDIDENCESTSSNDDDYSPLLQLDGANDRPNLRKLRKRDDKTPAKHAEKRKSSTKGPSKTNKDVKKYKDTDSEDDFQPASKTSPRPVNLQNLRKSASPSKTPSKSQSKSSGGSDVLADVVKLVKGRIKEQKVSDKKRLSKLKHKKFVSDDDDDSDYAPEDIKKKDRESDDEFVPKVKVKKRVQPKSRRVLSSDDEEQKKKSKRQGVDVWVEVFLENEEKWVSVDVIKGDVHCVNELYTRATHPVSYIVAWNNDNTLKDVTARYCQNFNTITRKLRVDAKWWSETLRPFVGTKNVRDREEDDELERQQLEKPLPTSIAEFKNHPLYALKRHLLKFEGIYPPEVPPIGFVRNEAVYPRQCVYTLHSREIWLKQAKVVKAGEKPYKIVKARPKYDKLSNTVITDQLLEIFGPWQTEEYVPPTAENGVVPRNAYGNVELFKMCMLPKKTVHLQLPGLNKIARRMNIDCATAIVGFDFHGGWSHPTYDGFVVCEEFADVLVAAWEVEQEEQEKKEQEKLDKRVYGNWRKLIRGLLIRERLKAKYDFGGEPSTSKDDKTEAKKKKQLVVKKRKVCSSGESDSE